MSATPVLEAVSPGEVVGINTERVEAFEAVIAQYPDIEIMDGSDPRILADVF